jgi:hypothetical protein
LNIRSELKILASNDISDYKNLLFRVMKFILIPTNIKILFQLFLLLVTLTSYGQNTNLLNMNSLNGPGNLNIETLTQRQILYIKNSYSEKIEAPNELINGKEYASYYTRSLFKPLLFPDKKRAATIFTPTRQYNNLTLQYDTFLDEVIYTDVSRTINYSFPQIALNKDIVKGFNLYFEDDSLIFKYFKLSDCTINNLKEGFYEVAYQGKSRYVIKHVSSFYVREGLNEYKYAPENYMSTGDVFYRIKNRKDLLKLFGDKSGEIKKYLHLSRIRIRQADRNQFISILKFYDSLSALGK